VRTLATVIRVLDPLKGLIHEARLKCLCRVVVASFFAASLRLTDLGRALPTNGKPKHAIKRVDELLRNPHLELDAEVVQQYLAGLLAAEREPVLLVDWTDIGPVWTALVVTYVTRGRGLTLCWQVTSKRRQNSARLETQVLARIAKLLPAAKPVLVTDAGFRGPWMKKVTKRGWNFVGRVRGLVKVRREGGEWVSAMKVGAAATRRPKDLGMFEIALTDPYQARLVILRRKRKSKTEALPDVGRRKKRNIKSAREPLVFTTSLRAASAKSVADIYGLRWQIEMTFRDQKCARFGLGLDAIRTKQQKRVRAYMLLAVLAHYVAYVLGEMAEQAGLAREFQANTETRRRVLSVVRLGCEVIRRAAVTMLAALDKLPLHIPKIATLKKCGDP
jgi:Transposase DDE domain